MSIVLENLRRDARMRLESDREMSGAWIIIPLLPIIVAVIFVIITIVAFIATASSLTFTNTTNPGTPTSRSTTSSVLFPAFTFFGFFLLFIGVILLVGILFAFMLYKLIRRRNTHFSRQSLLYEDLVNLARELGAKKGVDVSLAVNNLDRTLRETRTEETEKGAVLWTVLSIIPYVGWIIQLYVYYFLNKDFFKHERKEDAFVDDLTRTLSAVGVTANLPRRMSPIPDRSFILYFILSIITLGLFGIYWIYTLLTDPNNHFRHQALLEDTILAQVSPVLA